jgi:hypothetical protein
MVLDCRTRSTQKNLFVRVEKVGTHDMDLMENEQVVKDINCTILLCRLRTVSLH